MQPSHKAAFTISPTPSHAGGVYERIKRSQEEAREARLIFTTASDSPCGHLFTETYSTALACLLCYRFSINLPHNRRARAPVLILSVPLQTERINTMVAVSLAKVHPAPCQRKVTTQKDKEEKKTRLPLLFLIKTRKWESSKDAFVQ